MEAQMLQNPCDRARVRDHGELSEFAFASVALESIDAIRPTTGFVPIYDVRGVVDAGASCGYEDGYQVLGHRVGG